VLVGLREHDHIFQGIRIHDYYVPSCGARVPNARFLGLVTVPA
jgi:hypothetical protein